jgi:hypothetical protein
MAGSPRTGPYKRDLRQTRVAEIFNWNVPVRLEFLVKQGLMRLADEKKAIYQGTSTFRIRLKYHAGHALLEQMRQVIANGKASAIKNLRE